MIKPNYELKTREDVEKFYDELCEIELSMRLDDIELKEVQDTIFVVQLRLIQWELDEQKIDAAVDRHYNKYIVDKLPH
jgi:hypothetical protein